MQSLQGYNLTAQHDSVTAQSDNITIHGYDIITSSDNVTARGYDIITPSDNVTAPSDNFTTPSDNISSKWFQNSTLVRFVRNVWLEVILQRNNQRTRDAKFFPCDFLKTAT
jgi:hypothetical protein